MVLVLTAIFCGLGLLAAMGLVPVLSDFLGVRTQDLGVTYAPKDILDLKQAYVDYRFSQVKADAGVTENRTESAPKSPESPSAVSREATLSVSNAQLSALLNSDRLAMLPMREIQAKMGPRTLELSGLLASERIDAFLKTLGAKNGLPDDLAARLSELDGAPLYLKLGGGVDNGSMNLKVQAVKIGLVPLPGALMSNLSERTIRGNLVNQNGYSIQSLQFGEGAMTFNGEVPADWGVSGP